MCLTSAFTAASFLTPHLCRLSSPDPTQHRSTALVLHPCARLLFPALPCFPALPARPHRCGPFLAAWKLPHHQDATSLMGGRLSTVVRLDTPPAQLGTIAPLSTTARAVPAGPPSTTFAFSHSMARRGFTAHRAFCNATVLSPPQAIPSSPQPHDGSSLRVLPQGLCTPASPTRATSHCRTRLGLAARRAPCEATSSLTPPANSTGCTRLPASDIPPLPGAGGRSSCPAP